MTTPRPGRHARCYHAPGPRMATVSHSLRSCPCEVAESRRAGSGRGRPGVTHLSHLSPMIGAGMATAEAAPGHGNRLACVRRESRRRRRIAMGDTPDCSAPLPSNSPPPLRATPEGNALSEADVPAAGARARRPEGPARQPTRGVEGRPQGPHSIRINEQWRVYFAGSPAMHARSRSSTTTERNDMTTQESSTLSLRARS